MRQRQDSAIFAGHNPPVSTPPGHAESAVVCLRPLKPRQLQPNEPNSRSTIRRSVGRRFWRLYHPRCFVNHLNRRTCPARRRSSSVEVVRTPVSGVRCLTSKALSCNPVRACPTSRPSSQPGSSRPPHFGQPQLPTMLPDQGSRLLDGESILINVLVCF
jgi:hypothetical protein